MSVQLSDIQKAAKRIAGQVRRTPVLTCESLDQRAGAQVFLKCENFQKVGAFKFRGASNAVLSLTDEQAQNGVATHSSGNHAQALALAARLRGIPAYIVMPDSSPQVKKDAVAAYGGRITFCAPTLQARESTLAGIAKDTGATVIHPYNNERVIAGQGTATLELLADQPQLDVVIAPVGGGGLLSGTAIAAKGLKSNIRVFGAEPEMADDAQRSLQAGKIIPSNNPKTIADGLLTSLGDLTFPILQKNVTEIITVSEQAIAEAMRFSWERTKLVIEPSSAVAIAALSKKRSEFAGLRVGIILSGGNVDLSKLPW